MFPLNLASYSILKIFPTFNFIKAKISMPKNKINKCLDPLMGCYKPSDVQKFSYIFQSTHSNQIPNFQFKSAKT